MKAAAVAVVSRHQHLGAGGHVTPAEDGRPRVPPRWAAPGRAGEAAARQDRVPEERPCSVWPKPPTPWDIVSGLRQGSGGGNGARGAVQV